jgi:hypothetical protein
MMKDNKPNWILFHCSAANSAMADQFDMINQSHKDRGFDQSSLGYHVGYQRLITGGKNYKAREDTEHGDHCNNPAPGVSDGLSMNFHSLGVCVGFDGDNEDVPAWAVPLLKSQIQTWMAQYNIPIERVMFHRDFNHAKTCPGSRITRPWLEKLLSGPPVGVDPVLQSISEALPAISRAISELHSATPAQKAIKVPIIQKMIDVVLEMLKGVHN